MYERAKDLLKLAIWMQGSATGLSLDDIQQEFGVQRRTAERMLDAVKELFNIDEPCRIEDQRRYWSLPVGRLQLLTASAEELAHLAAAVSALRQQNRGDAADALDSLGAKVRAAMDRRVLNRVEPDLELLMQAEGLAMRPGPRVKLDIAILSGLRSAILMSNKVRIRYRTRGAGAVSWHKVCPYGFLYGNRPYLAAFSRNPEILDFRTYRLSNIMEVEETDEPFERDPTFSLDAYARRSFGVFQEEPFDAVWKFSPEAAIDAREYVFHPDQTTEDLPDGSLIVRFGAGGAREMAWHLYTWGDGVEVLEPANIAERLDDDRHGNNMARSK
jgi:predicted DNA-binding transcriptional regulator YafY